MEWSPRIQRLAQRIAPMSLIALGLLCCMVWFLMLRAAGPDSLRAPVSDDAFYVLAVARNLAQGHGISYGGEYTNGFQPLFFILAYLIGAFSRWDLYAAPALLAKTTVFIYFVLGTIALRGLLVRILPEDAFWLFPVAALIWCLGPAVGCAHVGLETSLVVTAWCFTLSAAVDYFKSATVWNAVKFGVFSGFAFLARNDAIILVLSCGVLLLWHQIQRRQVKPGHFVLAGAVCVLLALPWIGYNVWLTGSIVPQSGAAEGLGSLYDAGRSTQIARVLSTVGRNLVIFAVPMDRLGDLPAAVFGALIIVGVLAVRRVARPQESDRMRFAIQASSAAGVLLAIVYAGLFGAPHMVNRWLTPVAVPSLLLALGPISVGIRSRHYRLAFLAAGLFLALAVSRVFLLTSNWSTNTYELAKYLTGLPSDMRVGTLQSGLPGWMRPTVSNLDGKVNTTALHAILKGEFGDWLVSSDLELAADWNFFGWDENARVLESFERKQGPGGLIVLERRKDRQLEGAGTRSREGVRRVSLDR